MLHHLHSIRAYIEIHSTIKSFNASKNTSNFKFSTSYRQHRADVLNQFNWVALQCAVCVFNYRPQITFGRVDNCLNATRLSSIATNWVAWIQILVEKSLMWIHGTFEYFIEFIACVNRAEDKTNIQTSIEANALLNRCLCRCRSAYAMM